MPSSYVPPDVIVTQVQRTVSSPRYTPQLPVVVVGQARQIETRQKVGDFSSGDDLLAPIPALAPRAIIDPATVDLLLAATTASGEDLGLFRLQVGGVGADAELINTIDTDGTIRPTSVRVFGTISLDYSVLSSRNNDLNTGNNDVGSGEPNGTEFTDDTVDFLSLQKGGISKNGDSFLSITAPAALAGDYIIRDWIANGSSVHTLVVEKVVNRTSAVPELVKSFTLSNANQPLAPRLLAYGFSTGAKKHIYGSGIAGVTGFAQTPNVTDAAILNYTGGPTGAGIGVEAVLLNIGTNFANLLGGTDTAPVVPGTSSDGTSSAATWLKVSAGTGLNAGKGADTDEWRSLIAVIKVGHWLRIDSTFGSATEHFRDFRVMAVDTVNNQIQLQNTASTSVNVLSMTLAAGGMTAITLLKVVRGADDATNAAGDFALGAGGLFGIPGLEVLEATPFEILFTTAIPAYVVDTLVTMRRGIPFRNTIAQYDVIKQLTSGFGGAVYMSYTADRRDLSINGLQEIANEQDIETLLGPIHPNNPLAFAASLVNQAGGTAGGNIFYALATNSSGAADFQAAFDLLETREDVYYIIPLSQDLDVIAAAAAHVTAMSQPLNKGERIALVNTTIPSTDPVLPTTLTAPALAGVISLGNRMTAVIDWTKVSVGNDIVVVSIDGTEIERQRISTVNPGSGYADTLQNFTSTGAVSFRITTHAKTRGDLAAAIRDYAASLGNRRVVFVWPDQILVSYFDKTLETPQTLQVQVPGFYACAAIAGYRSVQVPSQPMTNMGIPGIDRLINSNDYFGPDQLNTIAEGGTFILVQRTVRSTPTVRHQLTTDMTSIESRELSIGIAVDYGAKTMRYGLRPYIGKHNITSEFLTQLRGIGESLIRALVEARVWRQGSTLLQLSQDAQRPDEVNLDVSVLVLYPCNRINVTLYV
jgi:hypothetical protein